MSAVSAPTEDRQRRGYWADRESFLGPIMLAPAVLYIVLLVGVPFVIAIAYSVSDVTVGDQSIDWVGFDNFRAVWNQTAFQTALRNTFYFTIASQIVVLILA